MGMHIIFVHTCIKKIWKDARKFNNHVQADAANWVWKEDFLLNPIHF